MMLISVKLYNVTHGNSSLGIVFHAMQCQNLQGCSEQTALARQDSSCTYLAHYELESVSIIIIIITDINA